MPSVNDFRLSQFDVKAIGGILLLIRQFVGKQSVFNRIISENYGMASPEHMEFII